MVSPEKRVGGILPKTASAPGPMTRWGQKVIMDRRSLPMDLDNVSPGETGVDKTTPRPAPERVAPPKDGAAKPAPPPKPAPRPAEFRPFNPDAVRPPAAPAPVARPQSLINRDLSWLQF